MHGELVGTADCCVSEAKRPPLLKSLKEQRERLQRQLDEYDEAIKALEENPDFEKMINVLGKVTRI